MPKKLVWVIRMMVDLEAEDNTKKARIDSPPGLGGSSSSSDRMLQEILATVRETDGKLTRVTRDVEESKRIASQALTTAHATQEEMKTLTSRVSALEKGGRRVFFRKLHWSNGPLGSGLGESY